MKAILALFTLLLLAVPAHARDGYGGRPLVCDPEEYKTDAAGKVDAAGLKVCTEWISNVKQPHITTTCCGEADAYIADRFRKADDGSWIAIITRDYPATEYDDGEGGTYISVGVPSGTEVPIPNNKLDDEHKGNPSGHGIIFFNWQGDGVTLKINILCYFTPELS